MRERVAEGRKGDAPPVAILDQRNAVIARHADREVRLKVTRRESSQVALCFCSFPFYGEAELTLTAALLKHRKVQDRLVSSQTDPGFVKWNRFLAGTKPLQKLIPKS